MIKAYALIEVTPRRAQDVLSKVIWFDGVKAADFVAGPYDIIVTLECENMAQLGDLITSKINRISGVYRTVTCVSL